MWSIEIVATCRRRMMAKIWEHTKFWVLNKEECLWIYDGLVHKKDCAYAFFTSHNGILTSKFKV